jgi:hypothetical protein
VIQCCSAQQNTGKDHGGLLKHCSIPVCYQIAMQFAFFLPQNGAEWQIKSTINCEQRFFDSCKSGV